MVQLPKQEIPSADGTYPILYEATVNHTPVPDQFEMYTDDPMELRNVYNDGVHTAVQETLATLLQQQCAQKRLAPYSGEVPGQPDCGQAACAT